MTEAASQIAANTLGTDVPEEHRGAAAGILNTAAQLGTALGVSAAVLIAGATARSGLPLRGAPLSWALAAALAAGTALIALRRPREGPRVRFPTVVRDERMGSQ